MSPEGLDVPASNSAGRDGFDPLTGLLDRTAFLRRLDCALARPDRATGHGFALLLLDVDGFHGLNARLGFAAADRLLVRVAAAVRDSVGAKDCAARFGPDEVAVLADELASASDALSLAERVLASLPEGWGTPPERVAVRAHVGVVFASGRGGRRCEEVVKDARRALDAGRNEHGSRIVLHSPAPDPRLEALRRLEGALRDAVARAEVDPHYEPVLAPKTGRVDGFEVLLWKKGPALRRA